MFDLVESGSGVDISPIRKVFYLSRLGLTVRSTARIEQRRYQSDDADDIAGLLEHELSAYALTDHLVTDAHVVRFEKTFSVPVPATWWDHFRVVHLGRFWSRVARRWPPRYLDMEFVARESRLVTFHQDHQYPEANIVIKELGKPIVIEYYREVSL